MIITVAYKTGWRDSEIKNLTWDQVDLSNGIVRLETGETKNDEGRTIYLDDELKEVFQKKWDERGKRTKLLPYVFTNEHGTDRIKDIRGSWTKACEDAKIGKRLFHDFRRTAVRNMVRAGIPERVAMMVSGHKTRSVFERYNIVSDTDLKMAAHRLDNYLKKQNMHKISTITKINKKEGYSNVS
jgi:integrase